MAILGNDLVAFCGNHKYMCKLCDYNTSKKYNFDKHVLSAKHKSAMVGNHLAIKSSKSSKYFCECGKGYVDNSGLWRHKKKCSVFKMTPLKK